MIEFTLFGFPVRIQPWFWAGMAIIGGALNVSNTSDLLLVALFMIAGTISILIHELGHAFAGRWLGNAAASISLVFLAGYTEYFHPRFRNHGRALSVLAGPLATLIPGIVAVLAVVLYYAGGNISEGATFAWLLAKSPWYAFLIQESFGFSAGTGMQLYFMGCLLFTSFWWTLLNLLPIYPLDGGQIVGEFVKSPRRVHVIGLFFSVVFALLAFGYFQSFILGFFMVMFAFGNFRAMKSAPF